MFERLSPRENLNRSVRLGLSLTGLIWCLACLSVGGWLLAKSQEPSQQGQHGGLVDAASPASYSDSQHCPIDQIRVGQRVVTPESPPGEICATAVDPATWKLLNLRIEETWADGTKDVLEIQTLQPPQWLEENDAKVGGQVPTPIELHEMGLEQVAAQVVSIEPCPVIEHKQGRVVLTTISSLSNNTFDLSFHDESGERDTVGVTGGHKLYSEERGWVSAADLHPGEVMRGRLGPLKIESLVRRPNIERVYNMTVEGEHVYYVSGLELLGHNAGKCVEATVSKSKSPEAAKHIEDAQEAGHPSTLTIDRPGAPDNRGDSLYGIAKVPGKQLDEYPPAMFKEGGAGASVRAITPGDNMSAGAQLGNQLRKYPNGTKVKIKVVD
jgi:hypothetical protein